MKNKLLKYWIVENNGTQEFKDTVIKYLNETYKQNWGGDGVGYYGYDGNDTFNGTNNYAYIEDFQNNPTLLTIKQFKGMAKVKEMEKLYIKFEEGNKESLDKACKIAEGLGYKKGIPKNALDFEGLGLMKLERCGEYYTTKDTEDYLISSGYKEYKQKEKKVKFKLGEQIACSDYRDEEELEKFIIRGVKCYYTGGKTRKGTHIVEAQDGGTMTFKYISKIPKPKIITIQDINGNECKIEENKIRDLGFTKK